MHKWIHKLCIDIMEVNANSHYLHYIKYVCYGLLSHHYCASFWFMIVAKNILNPQQKHPVQYVQGSLYILNILQLNYSFFSSHKHTWWLRRQWEGGGKCKMLEVQPPPHLSQESPTSGQMWPQPANTTCQETLPKHALSFCNSRGFWPQQSVNV